MSITQDDLLDALRAALETPAGAEAPTVLDLTVTMSCTEARVRKALRALATQGRLEVVRVRSTSINGAAIFVPGYRIKAA